MIDHVFLSGGRGAIDDRKCSEDNLWLQLPNASGFLLLEHLPGSSVVCPRDAH